MDALKHPEHANESCWPELGHMILHSLPYTCTSNTILSNKLKIEYLLVVKCILADYIFNIWSFFGKLKLERRQWWHIRTDSTYAQTVQLAVILWWNDCWLVTAATWSSTTADHGSGVNSKMALLYTAPRGLAQCHVSVFYYTSYKVDWIYLLVYLCLCLSELCHYRKR